MGHGYFQLRGGNRRGQRRVYIAHDDQAVKSFSVGRAVLQDGLHFFQDSAGLRALAAGTHVQPHVRLPDAKVLKKDLGEVVIVVLAGVDQADVYVGGVLQRAAATAPSS